VEAIEEATAVLGISGEVGRIARLIIVFEFDVDVPAPAAKAWMRWEMPLETTRLAPSCAPLVSRLGAVGLYVFGGSRFSSTGGARLTGVAAEAGDASSALGNSAAVGVIA